MTNVTESNWSRFRRVISEIRYPGFEFDLSVDASRDCFTLRIVCEGTDNVTGHPLMWRGRKWPLSIHMTDGEVVQTAWLALKVAQEHEARELFTYKGVTVFNPHFDIDQLVKFAEREEATKERENALSILDGAIAILLSILGVAVLLVGGFIAWSIHDEGYKTDAKVIALGAIGISAICFLGVYGAIS